jgi:hypothetical protein
MATLHFKRIPLHPTLFELDVWVCEEKEPICEAASKLYGETPEHYDAEVQHEMCCWLEDKEGVKRIVIFLNKIQPEFVAHEALHATWQLAKFVGFRYSHKNQETQAYYIEYIVRNILGIGASDTFENFTINANIFRT